ncbi:MAG: Amuc_1102 family pilus-like protein [Lentisphaeria bacterium]
MQSHLKSLAVLRSALMVTLGCWIILTPVSSAQQRSTGGGVRVTDIEIEQVESPQYQAEGGTMATSGSRLKWLRITIEYESRGGKEGWIDSLRLDWNVLLLNGDTPRLLMKKSVTYMDVWEEDDEHFAVIYVRPRAILRHYDDDGDVKDRDVLIHLEAFIGGQMVKDYNYNKSRARVPDRWWTFSAPQVKPLKGALLSRDQTPFAPLDYDSYETIAPGASK